MTPEEDYDRRLENMRAALARVWDEGYRACLEDTYEEEASEQYDPIPNPYVKEGA